ncbi:MAG: helix-turn-helix domain-containing protein [Tenericutes bacterium]|jgi:predicted nucleotidyltransferase|nr:helix-turn-helix domain-containing protein [Mycoplasmatota bacterium]
MVFKIKETRAKYNITQQELSDITSIPKRTIENWESGKRQPSPWVEKLVDSYIKQFPKNNNEIITDRLGVYEIVQIKEILLPLTIKYDIYKIILFGSYAKGEPDLLSDINLAIDGAIEGLTFFGLLEEINQLFVKDVDLLHMKEIEEDSNLMKDILKGIVLYKRKE